MQTLSFKHDSQYPLGFRYITGKTVPSAGERVFIANYGEATVALASEDVIDLVFDETLSGCFAFKVEEDFQEVSKNQRQERDR